MARKEDRLESIVNPNVRFLWGFILIFILIASTSWEVRAALTLLAAVLATAAGKRISVPYFLFLTGTVTFFHLFMPFGKVVFSIGPFPITEGALLEGWNKGLTLSGLVFLSLFSISRSLRLPGKLGSLWSLTFSYYERLLQEKKTIDPKAIFLSLDRILERIFPTRGDETPASDAPTGPTTSTMKTNVWGWTLATTTITASVTLLWLFR